MYTLNFSDLNFLSSSLLLKTMKELVIWQHCALHISAFFPANCLIQLWDIYGNCFPCLLQIPDTDIREAGATVNSEHLNWNPGNL